MKRRIMQYGIDAYFCKSAVAAAEEELTGMPRGQAEQSSNTGRAHNAGSTWSQNGAGSILYTADRSSAA